MKRLGAIVLFSGAVLLSTHIMAPAEPPARRVDDPVETRAALAQSAPLVERVDAEVERLRERLAEQRTYPPPTRDPFRYGTRRESSSKSSSTSAVTAAAPAVDVVHATAPQVIAIVTNRDGGASAFSAVLAIGDNVHVVKPGDTFGAFVVRVITAEEVELVESATGQSSRVALK